MKRKNLGIGLLLIIVLGSIGLYVAYPRITSTAISQITINPGSFTGREVNVFGTIVEREEDGFTLADGSGTIEVDWAGTLPPVGTQRVFVHGFVRGERVGEAKVSATSVDIWPV